MLVVGIVCEVCGEVNCCAVFGVCTKQERRRGRRRGSDVYLEVHAEVRALGLDG